METMSTVSTQTQTINSVMLEAIEKIWNAIPEPNNIYDAIRSMHVYSQVFGLACYKTVNKRGLKSYSVTAFTVFRNVLQMCLFCGAMTQSSFAEGKLLEMGDIASKIEHFQNCVSRLLAVVQLVMGMIFCRKLVKIYKNIDEIDRRIKSIAIRISYKSLFFWNIIAAVLTQFLMLNSTAFGFYIYWGVHGIFYILLQMLAYIIPYFVNVIVDLQYVQFTEVLRTRYRLLNEHLETILDDKQPGGDEWAQQISKISTTPVGATNKSAIRIVNSVAALHVKLTDTSLLVCRSFCCQVLLLITISFVGLVVALFLMAMNFSKPVAEDTTSTNVIFTSWAFINIVELVSIVHFTCKLCEEANNCARILHKIRNGTKDTPLHDTIDTYSLQMHQNRLQFHICGLFPLDYTLLNTIIAGATTYLVILIQFNNTDSSNNGRSLNSTKT